ncbi:MAG: PVC-type heme-binding CxxCH protein, partial [Planctomycetota bacterium]
MSLRAFSFVLALVVFAWFSTTLSAQDGNSPVRLEFSRWSGALNIPDPVAISLDHRGRAYVTQTQRRKAQDLDIRNFRQWTADDVGFESVDDKRAFYHRRLAPLPAGEKGGERRVGDFDANGSRDYRDLMVLSEKIHLVEDSDGDGTADRFSLFAEGFRTEVTGIAAGVLWHEGSVYSTIAPDVWRLRDTNGDGRADERSVVSTGFGVHIAYAGHDMHGLTVGPDGKIYWTIGDKGISARSKDGQRYHYPNQGGVMRCNPDGSDFEVFAHGLRNVQEIAFDAHGNLFGVDNDADQRGERERVVYIVEGMDAGWRCNYQYRGGGYNPWTAEKLWTTWFESQAAYITPPLAYSLDGPAGFAFNPGTALHPEYRDHFFVTGAPGGQQRAFKCTADGASFRVENDHRIGRGVPLVGINFGPGGALYGVDWGGGYPLNKKGAIWKIDVPGANDDPTRKETAALLSSGFEKLALDRLVPLLSYADQRVRLGAQFQLVRRSADAQLSEVAVDTNASRLARLHAIWGLGQRGRLDSQGKATATTTLVRLLAGADPDAEIRTQSAKTLGEQAEFDGRHLIPLLNDPSPRVRFHAAVALGRHRTPDAVPALIQLGEGLQASNTYLRHACAYGLSGSASPTELTALHKHESSVVRLIAVVALRHFYDRPSRATEVPEIASFTRDEDSLVATEAARAIYEGLSRRPLNDPKFRNDVSQLAATLPNTKHLGEAFVRRAIGAAFLLGDRDQAVHLARFAARADAPKNLRKDALDALARWTRPPQLDRVDGRRRKTENQTREFSSPAFLASLAALLAENDSEVRAAALSTARALRVEFSDEDLKELAQIARREEEKVELRLQALSTLSIRKYSGIDSLLTALRKSGVANIRMQALESLGDKPRLALAEVRATLGEARRPLVERQHALRFLAKIESPAADTLLEKRLDAFVRGKGSSATQLDLLTAVRKRAKHSPGLATKLDTLTKTRATLEKADPLATWVDCLDGGDPASGREIFLSGETAACVRCHRVGGTGSTIGPDLEGIAKQRDAKSLLRSIVFPSAEVDEAYRSRTL